MESLGMWQFHGPFADYSGEHQVTLLSDGSQLNQHKNLICTRTDSVYHPKSSKSEVHNCRSKIDNVLTHFPEYNPL